MITFNGKKIDRNDFVKIGNWTSKYFKYREFQSKDGNSVVIMNEKTIKLLEELREWLGAPIVINSAYRSPGHNKKVGGATNSQHVKGTAVDIKVNGYSPIEVAAYGQKLGFDGIGLYNTFTHLDTRGFKARWGSYKGQTNFNNIKLKPKNKKGDDLVFENIKVKNKDKEITARVLVETDSKGNRIQSIKFDDLRKLGIDIGFDNKTKTVIING